MPPMLVDYLKIHLAEYVHPGPRAHIFTGGDGGDLRRDNWHRDANWRASLKLAGLPRGFHRAAMVYQHATDERDREIADLLAGLVDKYRKRQDEGDEDDDGDGSGGALAPIG